MVEVEFNQGDSESDRLKEQEQQEQIEDQLRKIRANLRSEISSGLTNVEKVGDQILSNCLVKVHFDRVCRTTNILSLSS